MQAFRYVVEHDHGHAPNYELPYVTLAVCKPKIRLRAERGDLVIGFQGRKLGGDPHAVRWAGIVSEKLSFASYWNDERFQTKRPSSTNRGDNIYEEHNGQLRQVRNRIHSKVDAAKDLSGRYILIFERAWRFTADTARRMPAEIDLNIALPFRRGHRVTELSDSQFASTIAWLDEIQPGGAVSVSVDDERVWTGCGPVPGLKRKPSPKPSKCRRRVSFEEPTESQGH